MMVSNRPYMLRAFYEWIIDSNCTPMLVVNAHHPECRAPLQFSENGEFVFTLSKQAVIDVRISTIAIQFTASFGGVVHSVYVPLQAVRSLYSDETGEGIYFDDEGGSVGGDGTIFTLSTQSQEPRELKISLVSDEQETPIPTERKKPFLRLVE